MARTPRSIVDADGRAVTWKTRLPLQLREDVREVAKQHGRSLAAEVRHALVEHVAKHLAA